VRACIAKWVNYAPVQGAATAICRIDVKNVVYVFYSGHVFYVFNVFYFANVFYFLKTFIENTI